MTKNEVATPAPPAPDADGLAKRLLALREHLKHARPDSADFQTLKSAADALTARLAAAEAEIERLKSVAHNAHLAVREERTIADTEKARAETAKAEASEWKLVAKRAGVCMTCAIRAPEPYGCSDCLNTGWEQGAPAGYVEEAEVAALKADVERKDKALAPFDAVAERDIGDDETDADFFRPMSNHNRAPRLTVGDFRRARTARNPEEGK